MLKSFGVLFIFTGCGGLGLMKASELKKHCSFLQDLLLAVELLETEIQFRQNPLPVAFEEVEKALKPQDVSLLFGKAAAYLKNNPEQLPAVGWAYGVEEIAGIVPLNSLLKECLISFGQGLGMSDRSSQVRLFEVLKTQIREALEQAQNKRQKEERMWQYLGFAAGAGLVLLLL